jgi:hypothetical protein
MGIRCRTLLGTALERNVWGARKLGGSGGVWGDGDAADRRGGKTTGGEAARWDAAGCRLGCGRLQGSGSGGEGTWAVVGLHALLLKC